MGKLLVFVIHGIGPQNDVIANGFSAKLRKRAAALLKERGKPLDQTDLVIAAAHWSDVYEVQAQQWLSNNYPAFDADTAMRRPLLSWGLRLLVFLVAVEALFALTCFGKPACQCLAMLPHAWRLGLAAVLIPVGMSLLAWLLANKLGLPWGDLWHAVRGFEAETLADVIVYETEKGKQAIFSAVLRNLKDSLLQQGLNPDSPDFSLPVLLIGHSLGSVICYDLLLGSRAAATDKSSAMQERDDLAALAQPSAEQASRREYLQLVVNLQECLRPVGLATFGAPISFFVFRKLNLVGRSDLWKTVVPPEFETAPDSAGSAAVGKGPEFASNINPALRWRWQNFWHASDFVAHKLHHMFNAGTRPEHPFVDDLQTRVPVADPMSAHASYWRDDQVISAIALRIAELLEIV